MDAAVVGLGKLGICLAGKLAEAGFRVYGIDNSTSLIASLDTGTYASSEPGVKQLLLKSAGKICFSTDIATLPDNELVLFIVVPTPSDESGAFSSNYVRQVLTQLVPLLTQRSSPTDVVLVSTVMPGTCSQLLNDYPALSQSSSSHIQFFYNPEFIALGSVLRDMEQPDLLLIGQADDLDPSRLLNIYSKITKNNPKQHVVSYASAELAKLSINTYLTQKITFANQVAHLCSTLDQCSTDEVLAAVGCDTRIGSKYLKPGLGFGGPCLPRDTVAFSSACRSSGLPSWLSDAVQLTDQSVYFFHASKIINILDQLKPGTQVLFNGISYKPGSWLLEQSPPLCLYQALLELRPDLKSYFIDPLQEEILSYYSIDSYGDLPQLYSPSNATNLTSLLIINSHSTNIPDALRAYPVYDPARPHLCTPTSPYLSTAVVKATPEQILPIESSLYQKLVQFYSQALGVSSLSSVHESLPPLGDILLSKNNDQSTRHHSLVHQAYDSQSASFYDIYERLIAEILKYCPADSDTILVQRFPTVRFQYPSNISVYSFHKDSQYNHPVQEHNHLLYLTPTYQSDTLIVERRYNHPFERFSDYSPVPARLNQVYRLNTATRWHGDLPSLRDTSRVSIDFRFLASEDYASTALSHSGKYTFTADSYYIRFNTKTLKVVL